MKKENLIIWPTEAPSRFVRIQRWITTGERHKARELLEEYLSDPSTPEPLKAAILNNLGVVYQELGLRNKAVEYYVQAERIATQINRNEMKIAIHYNLGHLYFFEERWDESTFHLEIAIRLVDPDVKDEEQYGEIARSLLMEIQPKKALIPQKLDSYSEAKEFSPADQVEKIREVARIYASKGLPDEALSELQKAVVICSSEGLGPLEAIILNEIAVLLQTQELHKEARPYFERALESAKKNRDLRTQASVCNNLGLLLKEQQRFTEAVQLFEECLTIKNTLGEEATVGTVLYNLASLYNELGETGKAVIYAQRALRVDQKHSPESVEMDRELIAKIKKM